MPVHFSALSTPLPLFLINSLFISIHELLLLLILFGIIGCLFIRFSILPYFPHILTFCSWKRIVFQTHYSCVHTHYSFSFIRLSCGVVVLLLKLPSIEHTEGIMDVLDFYNHILEYE